MNDLKISKELVVSVLAEKTENLSEDFMKILKIFILLNLILVKNAKY